MLPLWSKKDFADVIKIRILRRGDYVELSGWALKAISSVLIKGRKREIVHREEVKAL